MTPPTFITASLRPPSPTPILPALPGFLPAEVANSQRWAQAAGGGEEGPPVVHIAERFRLAYLSREQRVRAKMERNWQQQRRRELRQRTAAEVLIRQWESEL